MITSLLEFRLLLPVYLSDHGLHFPHDDDVDGVVVVVVDAVDADDDEDEDKEDDDGNDSLKLIVSLSNHSPTFAKVITIQPI